MARSRKKLEVPARASLRAPRPSGIPALGDLAWGTHGCLFFETAEDLLETVVPFVRAGLAGGELCVWSTAEPLPSTAATEALGRLLPDVEGFVRSGQLVIEDVGASGQAPGRDLAALAGEAEARGLAGLRLAGCAPCLPPEAHDGGAPRRALALCSCPLTGQDPRRALELVATHQFALIKNRGAWRLMDGPRHVRSADAAAQGRSLRRERILADTASRLLVSTNPQGLVEELCREVMSFLDCHAFFNFLVDETEGRLHLNAYAGIPPEAARHLEWLDYGVAVCGCAARDATRIVAEDIPHTADVRTDLVRAYGLQAYAAHPLMCDGRVLGTLSFGTRTRLHFSEADLALMKTVADLVAVAMHRVQTEEALRQARDGLERRVKERTSELERANQTLREEMIERQRAEAVVQADRARFNAVLETLPAYLVLLAPDYHVPFSNRFFRERFGESGGRRCYEYLFNRTEPCENCESFKPFTTKAPHHWEWEGPDGRTYDIHDFPFTDTDGSPLVMEMGIDVTDRKKAEAELREHRAHLERLVATRTSEVESRNAALAAEVLERSRAEEELRGALREKEVLLKEIHHRVKNNLQIVASFLSLQAAAIKDPAQRQPLLESENRVRALALIHEKLYGSKDLSRIPFKTYVSDLATVVATSYRRTDAVIRLDVKADEVDLDVGTAIPVALIVNELLSNAYKHAFPARREGRVALSLSSVSPDRIQLAVTDDGVGLPPEFALDGATGMGFQLVSVLTRQLGGSLAVGREPGSSFTLTFGPGA